MAFHTTILLHRIAVFAEMIYHNNRGLWQSVDREDRAQGGTKEDRYVHIPVWAAFRKSVHRNEVLARGQILGPLPSRRNSNTSGGTHFVRTHVDTSDWKIMIIIMVETA